MPVSFVFVYAHPIARHYRQRRASLLAAGWYMINGGPCGPGTKGPRGAADNQQFVKLNHFSALIQSVF